MEIIHATRNLEDIAEIRMIKQFDAIVSLVDKSDFFMSIPSAEWTSHPIRVGDVIYIPGTEWGGFVNRVKIIDETVEVYGDLWREYLNKNLIIPPSGQAYLTLSGTPETVIPQLLSSHFGDLFVVESGDISNMTGSWRYHKIGRGIERSLKEAGGRLEIELSDGKPKLKAVAITDWSAEYEFNEDYGVVFSVDDDQSDAVNHIVALGKGELTNRRVLEAWLLPDGTITYDGSHPQRPTGINEVTKKLDYPNAEDDVQLKESIVKTFSEAKNGIVTEINLSQAQLVNVELGDKVGSRNRMAGIHAVQTITEKILKISDNGIPVIRYTTKEKK